MENNLKLDRIKGCLVGLAIGDAIGVHLEFTPKHEVNPVSGFTPGNPYSIPMGCWTDDTSMALCLGQSLIDKKGFDPKSQMENYVRWHKEGYMSSTGRCFDIGNTTRHALMEYRRNPDGGPFRGLVDFDAAGNGSIMRLAPIPMFYHNDFISTIFYAGESSRVTHGNILCIDACRALSEILYNIINLNIIMWTMDGMYFEVTQKELHPKILEIVNGSYQEKEESEIKGSGFVVNSLEAALWACHNSRSFSEAILKAVNLGDDADTTGAIAGQIAGAFFGYSNIPQEWLNQVHNLNLLTTISEELYNVNKNQYSTRYPRQNNPVK